MGATAEEVKSFHVGEDLISVCGKGLETRLNQVGGGSLWSKGTVTTVIMNLIASDQSSCQEAWVR